MLDPVLDISSRLEAVEIILRNLDGGLVHQGLGRLLHSRVEVADDRLHPADGLAFEFDLETEHAVRGRMLRPKVQRPQKILLLL